MFLPWCAVTGPKLTYRYNKAGAGFSGDMQVCFNLSSGEAKRQAYLWTTPSRWQWATTLTIVRTSAAASFSLQETGPTWYECSHVHCCSMRIPVTMALVLASGICNSVDQWCSGGKVYACWLIEELQARHQLLLRHWQRQEEGGDLRVVPASDNPVKQLTPRAQLHHLQARTEFTWGYKM